MRLSRRLLGVCISAFLGSAGAHLPSATAQHASAQTVPAAVPTKLAGPPARTSPQLAATGNVIRVGPERAVRTIAEAARLAEDGDTVEIDAATYTGDVAAWRQSNLTIRGVPGPDGTRPVLDANMRSASGKGIFVIQGHDVVVESLEFRNAKVPDRNGAGIRMEGTRLPVRNTVFRSNETGILTYYNPAAVLEVHDSQFIDNGFRASQGQAHAIYVGEIARFLIQGSYLTGTQVGHLIKSRAHQTHVRYNRITGESSTASYEVDLPNGGMAYLIGNLIEQGPTSQNRAVIAFGEEGMFALRPSQLYVSHNTLVNRLAGWCAWIHAPTGGWVKVVNTVMLGNCIFNVASRRHFVNNPSARATDFADPAAYDFRLRSTSALGGTAVAAGTAGAFPLESAREYRHIATSVALEAPPSSPGAFQSMR